MINLRDIKSRGFWKGLFVDSSGAVAMIFALALLPIFGAVGLAVDSSLGYLMQSRMSKSLDAAALAAGRVALNDSAELVARQYFDANFETGTSVTITDFDFDLDDSHVIAAMVRKYVEAAADGHRPVTLWGSGEPSREFLYVDDAARGLLLCAERLEISDPVNLGVGRETKIRDLAEAIGAAAGFEGDTVWDATMPDGQMKRGLDVSKIREHTGFVAEVALEQGIGRTVEWFREHELGG